MTEIIRHIHILGIGGSGLSAIAHLLLEQGRQVSGCDRTLNAASFALARAGATVFEGHGANHLEGVDALLVTSAVSEEHPEVLAARERGLPVMTRHDLWASWSAQRPILAVAGTHGKTTTTGMLAHILTSYGLDCGYLIGAPLPKLGAARWGRGPLVLEADEYARTFLALRPKVAIVTNVDWDHVDIYPTPEAYDADFLQFARATLEQEGAVIACGDDAGVQRVLAGTAGVTLYGLGPENEWRATRLQQGELGLWFRVEHAGTMVAEVVLQVPGEHNVRNALAALVAASHAGVDVAAAAATLTTFRGAARRFEPKGEAGEVLVFDDYAHHPAEIRATLRAARGRFPGRRLVAYFQPHTYSRLQAFLPDFGAALAEADVVRVGEVYAAREAQAGGGGQEIVGLMQHADARYVGGLDSAVEDLLATVRAGDVLLTLGAGDGYLVGERVLQALGGAAEDER